MTSNFARAFILAAFGMCGLTACPEPQALPAPIISSLQPDSGAPGTEVVVTGNNLGNTTGQAQVVFGGQVVANAIAIVPGQSMKFRVPTVATGAYEVKVVLGGRTSNSGSFKVMPGSSSQSQFNAKLLR